MADVIDIYQHIIYKHMAQGMDIADLVSLYNELRKPDDAVFMLVIEKELKRRTA